MQSILPIHLSLEFRDHYFIPSFSTPSKKDHVPSVFDCWRWRVDRSPVMSKIFPIEIVISSILEVLDVGLIRLYWRRPWLEWSVKNTPIPKRWQSARLVWASTGRSDIPIIIPEMTMQSAALRHPLLYLPGDYTLLCYGFKKEEKRVHI